MDIFDFLKQNWNSVTVGMAALFVLYLAHKEVWVFGTASRREIAAERKIIEMMQERIDQLEAQNAQLERALERAQMNVLRGNLVTEKTVQMAEQLWVVAEELPARPKRKSDPPDDGSE